MNKLKLFISVGICGTLFSGCSFIDSLFGKKTTTSYIQSTPYLNCQPQDLTERLQSYGTQSFVNAYRYNDYFKDFNDKTKCDEWRLEHYKYIVSQETSLPTNLEEEEKFVEKWQKCNVMPKWLETKLNEYIEQNKNDDKAYIEASKFKESWQTSERLSGTKEYSSTRMEALNYEIAKESVINCKAIKVATKATENDLIDLGNGKKAKCADLSYKDAEKCQSHFDSVYKKAKEDYELKQQRIEYEKKNKKQFIKSP